LHKKTFAFSEAGGPLVGFSRGGQAGDEGRETRVGDEGRWNQVGLGSALRVGGWGLRLKRFGVVC
jgi:hypothetical protein